jgi:hypothetical protein
VADDAPDEAVERAAQAALLASWPSYGWDEINEDARNHYRDIARAVLLAATPRPLLRHQFRLHDGRLAGRGGGPEVTILCRIDATPENSAELTVCGTPTKAWLDWLLTAEVGLTSEQIAWRELHRQGLAERSSVAPQPEETE